MVGTGMNMLWPQACFVDELVYFKPKITGFSLDWCSAEY